MKKTILGAFFVAIILSASLSTAFAAVKITAYTSKFDFNAKQFRGKIIDFSYTTSTFIDGRAPMVFLTIKDKNNQIITVEFSDEDVRMGETFATFYEKYVGVNYSPAGDVSGIFSSYPS